MGKVYLPPMECGEPPTFDISQALEVYFQTIHAYEQKVVAWCQQHGNGAEAGKIVRFPVGDGKASYVIQSLKPVVLLLLPCADEWEYPYIERLTAADIRKELKWQEARMTLFTTKQRSITP